MIKTEFRRVRLAVSFLTTIPLPMVQNSKEKDQAKSLIYAPVVGLAIGGLMLLVWQLVSYFPVKPIAAVFVVLAYVLLTGGLHLDGLADSCDGVFSNRPRARMLEIMRDSHIGTNGVIALVFVILTYWVAISALPSFLAQNAVIPLLLMPVAGRTGSIVAAGISKYARDTEGLGKNFVELLSLRDAIIGGILALLIFYLVGSWRGVIMFIITVVSTLAGALFFQRKLGGVTGDALGAICEMNQVVFILGYFIIGGI